MSITIATGNDVPEADAPPLNDIVPGCIDLHGRPAVRSKSGCWKSASFIIGVAMAERFCYYGISSNLVSYLTAVMGQSTAAAAANLNAWDGTAALSPIIGAFVADSFLGRYRTIIFSSLIYILGLGFLSLSAAINPFNSSISFFFSLYLVALAQGGYKPCIQAFGADQFDVQDNEENEAKSSFFNWCFWFSCFSVLLAFSVLYYIQDNLSWEVGFAIPCIVMCLALVLFWIGTITYRFHINGDPRRPFWGISSRVFVNAVRSCQPAFAALSNQLESQRILPEESAQFDSVDRALLAHDNPMEDEKKCSIGDVDRSKAILRLLPICCTCLGYSIVYAQPPTLFTKQAATLDRYITSTFQIPAASLQLCIVVSIIVFLPIYDRILIPIARAITKRPSGISKLQRVGTGLCLSLISTIVAALVERKRLAIALESGLVDMPKATVPMSVWWLAPQYLLSGVADVFGMVGIQEFFYDQVPSELKSTGISLYLSVVGIGGFVSSFLVSVIQKATNASGRDGWFSDNLNRAHLDYFYWLLAGISAFSLAAYVYFAKSYCYCR